MPNAAAETSRKPRSTSDCRAGYDVEPPDASDVMVVPNEDVMRDTVIVAVVKVKEMLSPTETGLEKDGEIEIVGGTLAGGSTKNGSRVNCAQLWVSALPSTSVTSAHADTMPES